MHGSIEPSDTQEGFHKVAHALMDPVLVLPVYLNQTGVVVTAQLLVVTPPLLTAFIEVDFKSLLELFLVLQLLCDFCLPYGTDPGLQLHRYTQDPHRSRLPILAHHTP